MKRYILYPLILCGISAAAFAQATATFDNHSRFKVTHDQGDPYLTTGVGSFTSISIGANTWSNGANEPAGEFFAQIAQYNVGSDDYAAFDLATDFTIDFTDEPNQDFSLYATTIQYSDASFVDTPSNFLGEFMEASGSNLSNRAAVWLNEFFNNSGVDATFIGDFSAGTTTIAGNANLNTLLGGTTFEAQTDQIYVFALPQNINGGFEGLTLAGSVTAVPEPSSYALISGALALGWIMVRRRK